MTVAVGFSPRNPAGRRRVAERRRKAGPDRGPKRRAATQPVSRPGPWTEVHGYPHALAPRGPRAGQAPVWLWKGWRGVLDEFGWSRSDPMRVAVGFSPRNPAGWRRVAERRWRAGPAPWPKRRSATQTVSRPGPWTEVHGYHQALAPRGPRASRVGPRPLPSGWQPRLYGRQRCLPATIQDTVSCRAKGAKDAKEAQWAVLPFAEPGGLRANLRFPS